MKIFIILMLTSPLLFAQSTGPHVIGNYNFVCFQDSNMVFIDDSLPESLKEISCLMVFSNSISNFDERDIERITDYVQQGGGLYLGADNWPLQSEANQMTRALYSKESYGEFNERTAEVNATSGNLNLNELTTIPAGESTVAFPLDPRLTVEAWVKDEPLILSGRLGKGRIIIDGGYSRFYCANRSEISDELLFTILSFLSIK